MKNLLWSKANAKNKAGSRIYVAQRNQHTLDENGIFVPVFKSLRSRRLDEVNKRMRRFLHKPTPLVDLKGKPLDGYMQLDSIQKPKGFITRTDGSVVLYEGP